MLKSVSSITNAIGALNFKGTWDANANSPALASSVGTKGDYYVVGTAGATNLNGISNWGVGDLATFNGSVWQRVEGGADLNGVNLSVSGTSTLSNLTASTALALNASKEIVSVTNTGTGNNVLSAAPTFTGEIPLGTKAFVNSTGPVQAVEQFAVSSSGLAAVLKTSTSGEACLSNWNSATAGNNQFVWFYSEAAATFRGSIEYNRGSGLVLYNTSSDQRLKENIVDAQSAVDEIQKFKIRAYDWKDSNIHVDYGVVAQELILVAPSCVTVGVDNDDGSIQRPWGVDTSVLVPMLIKAVQELTLRVSQLENK